ncbi:MAG: heterodisulfide reductase-related iron-sulfur binding cluster, partial [Gammaproteobacteria bacterium]|nr:heterodisulfide reductase-related iron-sulfur binding cluster [Gammaproteobacteria bacterium]
HHLGDTRRSKQRMKTNIDRWWSLLEQGHETVVTTASGCGLMIKDYAEALQDEEAYAEKARIISENTRDIAEFLSGEDRETLRKLLPDEKRQLVFQSPCTLQHGQKLAGVTESLLASLGLSVQTPRDSHQCCGSAGTYSILQPGLSRQLRKDKLEKLAICEPDMILTSNIGCQVHLQETGDVPVKHWITLFQAGESG